MRNRATTVPKRQVRRGMTLIIARASTGTSVEYSESSEGRALGRASAEAGVSSGLPDDLCMRQRRAVRNVSLARRNGSCVQLAVAEEDWPSHECARFQLADNETPSDV